VVACRAIVSKFRLPSPGADLVGYGESETRAGVRVDMASQARWMIQMLDTLGLARAAVVAHDVGSAAAQIMLATAPQRVRSVVVLDGVYASEWAMDAIASIQAWDPQDADRLFPVPCASPWEVPALREMLKAYEGVKGGARLIRAARDLDPRQTENIGEAFACERRPRPGPLGGARRVSVD